MKLFFLGEGGKKLQLAVDGPGLSIASNTIFCLQCMDAGSLGIHPADQHPPCRHYTFGSNVAEEHQSYASVLCCIAALTCWSYCQLIENYCYHFIINLLIRMVPVAGIPLFFNCSSSATDVKKLSK